MLTAGLSMRNCVNASSTGLRLCKYTEKSCTVDYLNLIDEFRTE